jgi:transcriptional regulator with XRE-family HTH domain
MRTRPKKKKMKRLPEVSERAKHLRESLGMSQNQFAEHTGIARPRISEWEAGKIFPSAEACMLLGNAAPYPENLWFWEQAGVKPDAMASAVEKILKERTSAPVAGALVQIPLVQLTAEGMQETGTLVALPARFIPNPVSTRCLVVDDKSPELMFPPGDVVVFEPATGPQDPQLYWNEIVLAEFTGSAPVAWREWASGLRIGRLCCKRYRRDALSYIATLGPFSDSEKTWLRFPSGGESIVVGGYQHPGPPMGAGRDRNHAEEQAELQAPEKLTLDPGFKIIGRVVAWFRPPRPGRE